MSSEPVRMSTLVKPGMKATRGRRALARRLASIGLAIFGPTDRATQRQDVIRRAVVAAVIIAVLPIQGMRIPGWSWVVGACVAVIIYDLPLAYLVYAKDRITLSRTVGNALDALVLMVASVAVFREMGATGATSDIWLVFLVYIITGGFTFAPAGSILYTALWTCWFAYTTLAFFPVDSQYHEQLPIRLVFFATLGLIALGLASELEKRRARLAQQNRQTIGMLATLVEARDADVGAHLHHLQHFSRALARHVGLSEREAQEIGDASILHDVGKANVPDAVLQKPGPLTPEEWRVMEGHTRLGDDLLAENSDFEMARQVARWHHEHWDGGGYPDGLAGEEIPLAARIVAVADVYDALISRRPYKEAWPAEKAIRELQRMAGSHLDADIVAAFVDLSDQGVVDFLTRQIARDDVVGEGPVEKAA